MLDQIRRHSRVPERPVSVDVGVVILALLSLLSVSLLLPAGLHLP